MIYRKWKHYCMVANFAWSNLQDFRTLIKLDGVLCSGSIFSQIVFCKVQVHMTLTIVLWFLVFGCWIIKQGSQDSALNPFGLRKMISRGFLRRHGIPLLQLDAPSIIWQEKSGPWPKDCRAGSKRKLVMLTISWGWQGKSFITPTNSPGYL